MGRTMSEKILSRKTGQEIRTDRIYFCDVDCVMTHDVGTSGVVPLLKQFGTEKLAAHVTPVVVLDHFVPATTLSHAASHKIARDFVKRWNVKDFFDIGRGGICHQVLLEEGLACSGDLLVATDAHVTTYGGIGCLGLGVGVTDAAMALHTGKIWLRIPRVIGVELTGALCGACSKDLAIYLLTLIPFSLLNYHVVEFFGDGVHSLSMDDRFCLCNMLSEGGVKSCLVAGDEKTEQYVSAHAKKSCPILQPDGDAVYEHQYQVALEEIVPMLAFPHHPTNGRPAAEATGIAINQAFLGSCTNGRIEDLRVAAAIVKGNTVHPSVRMIVTPASQKIYLEALREGLIETFIQAGAMVTNSSCGACIGASSLLAPGEVCVSTSNRNFRGRMGSIDANIYLASPATVAKSALAGEITTHDC